MDGLERRRYPRSIRSRFVGPVAFELGRSFRSLRRSPGFAAAVALILGAGLAGAVTAWTAVHDVLVKPLGYADEDRLVMVYQKTRLPAGGVRERFALSDAQIAAVRERASTLADVAYVNVATGSGIVLDREGLPPMRVSYARPSYNFFPFLGVRALEGRVITPSDRGGEVAMISSEAWDRHFGRDPGVVGSRVRLGTGTHEIVGILPPSFRWFPSGQRVEFWPAQELEQGRASPFFFRVVGRLRDGATPAQVEAEVSPVLEAALHEGGVLGDLMGREDTPPSPLATIVSVREDQLGNVDAQLWIVAAAVGFVLVLAILNAALLLLIRVAGRSRDAAVRAAMGGGPGRVAAPVLAEAAILVGLAGLLGLGGAYLALEALRTAAPTDIPRVDSLGFSWGVVGMAGLVAAGTFLLVSVLPLLALRRLGIRSLLGSAATVVGEGLAPRTLRGPLVVAEVAVAVVLLAGAGLMVRSFAELHRAELGFRVEGVLQGRLVLPVTPFWSEEAGRVDTGTDRVLRISPEMERLRDEIRERVAQHPRVLEVALARHTPLSGVYGGFTPFTREGWEDRPMPPGEAWLSSNEVDPAFLPMMGAELLAGRWFDEEEDHASAPPVALISEALARRFWGEEDPVGSRFYRNALRPDGDGGFRWEPDLVTVVGVVRSMREWSYESVDETVYTPLAQSVPAGGYALRSSRGPRLGVFVRHEGDPGPVAEHLRMSMAEILPGVPLDDVAPMGEVAGRWLREPRFFTGLLGAFGVLALLLAAGGMAAVIGFGVSRRTREIGLRVALGARGADVVRLVVRECLLFAAVGLAVGTAAALALAGLLESVLFEVGPRDPVTLAGIAVLFAAAAAVAAWIPARAALAVDPADALRAE